MVLWANGSLLTQTASRLVQPFCRAHVVTNTQTDRHTTLHKFSSQMAIYTQQKFI